MRPRNRNAPSLALRRHDRGARSFAWKSALVSTALASVLGATAAHADERSDARRHFRSGMGLIAQRHFPEGIRELEAAYAILPHPNVLYNIARAYNDAGDTEHALEYLHRYLTHDVNDRAEVEAIVARLEARMRDRRGEAGATAANATAAATTTTTTTVTTGTVAPGRTLVLPTGANGTTAQADALRQTALDLLRLADEAEGHPGATTVTTTGGTATTNANAAANAAAATTEGGPETLTAAAAEETYEERVVTASRAAQSPLDAPNATAVITAQDIRLSGLTNVGELLRRVVGVDVSTMDASDTQIGIRGFNQRLANKVLVLIDGRSIYLDVLGVTLWPHVFPAVEEIDRIEIIRGPGSALYGADAFSGVVNIITRPPGEDRRQIAGGAGNGQWYRGAFVASGHQGVFAYRASVQYEQRATYEMLTSPTDRTWQYMAPSGEIGYRTPRFMLDLQVRPTRDIIVRAGLGGSMGPVFFTPTGLLRRFWSDLLFLQPYAQLEIGGFSARVFWNHFQGNAGPLLAPLGGQDLRANFIQDVVDADAQYSSRQHLGILDNTLQIGLNARMKAASWNYLDGDHTLWFFSGYLSDTARIGPQWQLVASARVDRHPLLDTPVFSPRGAIIFKPTARRAIRLTAGTAFRTPTLLELYFDLYYPTPIPGATVRGLGSEVYRSMNPAATQLQPETMVSVDLGYRDETLDRLQFEANVFWTRGSNLINLTPVVLDTVPGNLSNNRTINLGSRYYANDPGATYIMGAELGLRVSPIDGLDLFANYTFAYTLHDANSSLAANLDHPDDNRTPQHKLNVGVQLRTRFGLDLEAFAHYVSQTVWVEPVFDPTQGTRDVGFPLDQYVVVNGRIGFRFPGDRVDIGVVGTNLVDLDPLGHHIEHPFGAHLSARVLGTLGYRF